LSLTPQYAGDNANNTAAVFTRSGGGLALPVNMRRLVISQKALDKTRRARESEKHDQLCDSQNLADQYAVILCPFLSPPKERLAAQSKTSLPYLFT